MRWIGVLLLLCWSAWASAVSLTWQVPVQPDGSPVPNVTGYTLHVGSQSGQYAQTQALGPVLTTQAPDPPTGQTYYYVVTAQTASATSTYSNEVLVAGQAAVPLTLSVSPNPIAPGATLTVAWTNIATPTSTDWLGLYAPGTAGDTFLAWLYVNCTRQATVPVASGSCPVPLPPTLGVGAYEVRLYARDSMTNLLATRPLTVATTVTQPPTGQVTCSGPAPSGKAFTLNCTLP